MSLDLDTKKCAAPAQEAEAIKRLGVRIAQNGAAIDEAEIDKVLDQAGKFRPDLEKLVDLYRCRAEAETVHTTPAGELPAELEAAKLEREAAEVEPDSVEALQSRKVIEADPTYGQLDAVLHRLKNPHDPNLQHPGRIQARQLRRNARSERTEAQGFLQRTADPAFGERIHKLMGAKQGIENQMANLAQVAAIPQRIVQLTAWGRELLEDRWPTDMPQQSSDGTRRSAMIWLRVELKRLKALDTEGAPARAAADCEKLRRKGAELQGQITEASAARFLPENMAWVQ